MDYRFILEVAIILISTKIAGVLFKKIGLPEVLGAIILGVVFGLTGIIRSTDELSLFAEIGVILIMFSAGMETNFKELKNNAGPSIVITTLGVIVPFIFGFGVSFIIPNIEMKMRMFFGVILMATSVGITVAALKELNVLHGKVGSSVVTAAVIDDVIGVVVLAFFTASAGESTAAGKLWSALGGSFDMSFLIVLLNVIFFFAFALGVGVGIHFIFKYAAKRWPHTRRLSVISLGACFVYAWAAEELFGIAAITGAFMAGIMLSNMKESDYVESRVDMNAYMIFSPVFFVNIGVSLPYETIADSFNSTMVFFCITFVIIALLGKLVGAGIGAKICKYTWDESIKVGLSMMVRGEVCLIIANEGVKTGIMSQEYYPAFVLLIVVSSILTPVLLKLLYKKYPEKKLDRDMLLTDPIAVASNEPDKGV